MREVALFFAWLPPGVDALGECVPPPFYTSRRASRVQVCRRRDSLRQRRPRDLVMTCAPGRVAMSFLAGVVPHYSIASRVGPTLAAACSADRPDGHSPVVRSRFEGGGFTPI
jgi:hypothetical protein